MHIGLLQKTIFYLIFNHISAQQQDHATAPLRIDDAIVADDVTDVLAGTVLMRNVVCTIYEQLLRAVTSREPIGIISEELYNSLVREEGTMYSIRHTTHNNCI